MLYAVCAVADAALAAGADRGNRGRLVTKPLLMPLLHAATRPQGPPDVLARSTAAAQLLSWCGDMALLGRGRGAFLAGVGSFAGAHVSYVAGFLSVRDPQASWRDAGPLAAGTVGLLLTPVLAGAAGRRDPGLSLPVAAYAAILAGMVASSTMVDRRLPSRALRKIATGTGLFMLSDALIGVQRFLRQEPSPPLEAAIMLTYTAGQWCIADGVAAVT